VNEMKNGTGNRPFLRLLGIAAIMAATASCMIKSPAGDIPAASPSSQSPSTTPPAAGQIIADHSIVDRYANIPDAYINIVRTWLVDAAGESHSEAYRTGIDALAAAEPKFAANSFNGSFPAASSSLRLGSHDWMGEGSFWTNASAISSIENIIRDQEESGRPINVIFQAWCWDFTRSESNGPGGSGAVDPAYGCHWFGSTDGGPDGNLNWGLDAADSAITGNTVSLQTYLDAIDGYRNFCATNGYACVPVFSTGPVDGDSYDGEKGWQRFVKHEAIRAHVRADASRVLFDYGDILCYNDSGARNTLTWVDGSGLTHTFQGIHADNLGGSETGHIGSVGARRLARAMWWMLARLAGWDGN
jgi:hypothetical protein